jgi:fructose-1,6-bisphosphatase I
VTKKSKELIYDESSLYVTVFDPLDGSSNIDAAIPTGTHILAPLPLVSSDSI